MCVVIIPAAGAGIRFGSDKPKQYVKILGIPVIIRTIKAFEKYPDISQIIIAVNFEWKKYLEKFIDEYEIKKVSHIVSGGKQRQDSVSNALRMVDKEAKIVLVHDAVRPFVSQSMISISISNAKRYAAAVPGLMPKETIKLVDQQCRVIRTPDRNWVRSIQTPQAFDKDLLIGAYELANQNNLMCTDDASVVEAFGHQVRVFNGSDNNIKITRPIDSSLAESIINKNPEYQLSVR